VLKLKKINSKKLFAKKLKKGYTYFAVLGGELAVPFTCNPLQQDGIIILGISYGRQLLKSGVDT